jgi:hypothetical protein
VWGTQLVQQNRVFERGRARYQFVKLDSKGLLYGNGDGEVDQGLRITREVL